MMRAPGWLGALRARVGQRKRDRERARTEDALKWLHESEQAGRTCSPAELADRLGVGAGEAPALAAALVAGGLASASADGIALTPRGREYARRVLRTHRLWERYLADRTGVPPGEWHAEAERVEHELTAAEADRLARRLGDPRYDPHGDPIPTALGEVPSPRGVPLSRIPPGRSVLVTHVEDEPLEVYGRIVEAGLTPGLEVDVVGGAAAAADPARIHLRVRGVEHALTAAEATNVTVEPLPPGRVAPGRCRTLADARVGEGVRVLGVAPTCQGPQRRRLLDLGVVPGTVIEPELVSASGDPVAYRIRGAVIALRRHQAEWIEVEGAGEEAVSP
jgi:DtxR family transcriptional regulator, Mn-dependent transcriptional regulator